ncbi:hypothetical protein Tco_0650040 [Tanacetum coccineum]
MAPLPGRGSGNEFVYDPNPYSYNDTPPGFSYPPLQPQFERYSCELCGNDSHYGLAEYINSPSWSRPAFLLDDDEEYTIAITHDLPTEEPEYSLKENQFRDYSTQGINEGQTRFWEGDIHLVERLLYENSSPLPPEELNSTESFPPSHIPIEDSDPFMEDIDLFLASDESIPSGIDSD